MIHKPEDLRERQTMIPKTISMSTMRELERMLNGEEITYSRFVELINQCFEDRHKKLRGLSEKQNADLVQAKKDREDALRMIKELQKHLPIARVNLQVESDKLIKQLS